MNRRFTVLVGAVALAVTVAQAMATMATAATPEAARQPGLRTGRGTDAQDGLDRLRDDATGRLRVHRAADGAVDFVSSTNGHAMLEDHGAHGPTRTAADQLARYGEAFGIDGDLSRAVVKKTLDSGTGGSVVRSEQVVDGVPVFGGQVVMSLDEDQGVVSVDAATTEATEVPDAVVSVTKARESAVAVTAKTHRVATGKLSATSKGRRLYDPAIVHTSDPMGVRPVWEFEVTNGTDIRETVLVGSGRGEVALHFNDAPEITNRRVCDNAELKLTTSSNPVPVCTVAARSEGDPASVFDDVNQAYDNLGATSDAYDDLDGIDLTQLIGANVSGTTTLQSTVRWCFSDDTCPYANAFWDGTQMVFGTGYAAADDVVGHELTHGYVERTAGLFSFHQSGALNESLADTIGEIVDHRNPLSADPDSEWVLAEDIPVVGLQRSLKDPTIYGQPDRMRSSLWDSGDVFDDNGAVHQNDGVGNKTAYLISQGGIFNGQDITGIDGSDLGLAKTGLLYLEVIPKLTSGADYAQLGNVLVSTCQQLASDGTGGFDTSNCAEVAKAVTATELETPPTNPVAAAPKVAVECPTGTTLTLLKQDDEARHDFNFTLESLWQRTPDNNSPQNAESGTSSLFGWDPDPDTYSDPSTSSATTSGFTVPTGTSTYFNFHHAYLFEFNGTQYYDGGEALVERLVNGTWTPVTGLPWVNGAAKTRYGTTTKVFGGDSHGYGSSQVNLTSLADQTVRVRFRVVGDNVGSFFGWWIDDVRMYSCDDAVVPPAPVAPTAPISASVKAATTTAVVSWQPPVDPGSKPITSYRITRSDGKVNTASDAARSLTVTGLMANTNVTLTVAAVNGDGLVGPGRSVPVYATTTTLTSSVAKPKKGKAFTLTAKVVRRGTTTTVISKMPVKLQRHVAGTTTWRTVSSSTTSAAGTRSWSITQSQKTYYRVVAAGVTTWLGSTSAIKTLLVG
jgi:bacillolysin